jgi:hypothetical protein
MASLRCLAGMLLAAGVAAAGSGCGEDKSASGTAAPATSAQLANDVGRICSQYRETAGSLPPRPAAPAKFEIRLARLQDRVIAHLHALRPQTPENDAYHAWVGAQRYAFYAQAALRETGRSGEGDSPPARTARDAVDRAQRQAFRLGFDSCTAE